MKGAFLSRCISWVVLMALLVLGVSSKPRVLADSGATWTVCASGCNYTSIQAAINAANAGDTIQVQAGTYNEYLSITKSIILEGIGSDQVTLNATVTNGYGVYIKADSVTVKGLTIIGNSSTYYGIKAEESSNLTLKDLVVKQYGRSGIDLNGCTNSLIDTVTAQANGGAGIAITNSTAITMQHLTTSGNTWGGVALFTAPGPYTPGLSNITLTGTNSFGEVNPLYVQLADASHSFTGFFQNEFAYIVRNTAAPLFTWYQKDTSSVLSFINAANSVSPGFRNTAAIQRLSDGTFHVLSDTLKIQPAIDLATPGGTVYVYPGDYHEKAINRYVLGTNGPHQFGLFIGQEKTGLQIIGVNANGQPITNFEDVAASVTTYATNNFGYSGIFVEADDVTIQGLEIKDNIVGDEISNNKTLEIIGDNFTLRYCHINVGAGEEDGGSVYFGDWRFDPETNTSHIQRYTLEYNWFDHGTSVDLTNGAGYSGEVSERQIRNNKFANDGDEYWPFISFNGSETGVPWFVYSVGGAKISGNTFINNYNQIGNGVAHIRARGTYDNSQFDWASYWRDNTYNKAVIFGANPPSDLGTYSYTSGSYTFNNVRRIGVTTQNEVEKAVSGQTVLIKSGTYEEQVVVTGKDLTLQGEGTNRSDVVIKSPTTLTDKFTTSYDNKPVVLVQNNANVTLTNLTVDGAGRGNGNYRFMGVAFYNAGGTVENVTIKDVRDDPFSGLQHGIGIYAYNGDGTARTLTVRNTTVTNFQKNGITVVGSGLTATIENNTITGAGATSIIAQNGIQVSYSAAATVKDNTIEKIAYSGSDWVATGILVYGAGSTTVESNALTASQANIYVVESSATVRQNRISNPACGGEGCYGIIASDPLSARPSPLEEAVVSTALAQPNRSGSFTLLGGTNPLDTVTITANEITGTPYTSGESVGLGVYDGYADRDVAVSAGQNVISGWSYGVYVGRCDPAKGTCYSGRLSSLTLNENAITGNTVGMGTDLTIALNAERNWWSSARGPQVASNPGGDGQPVVGATIDYVPWLCDGTDAQPSQIGFQPVSGAATCTNAPTRLRFTVQPPTTAFTNEPFAPPPAVRVEDAQGNLAINYDNAILIALANNPAGGTLGGTLTADPVNGVATFTNLFLNKAGASYRLLATSGNLYAAYSNFFTVVDPSADLSLSLSAPGSVNAGSDFAYTLTVSNAGPKPAQSLTLTLNLPAGVTYQSASGSGWTCGHSAGVVTCTAASLASGASTPVTVTVTAPAQAGPITATASVSAASPTDPTPANNSTSAETTVVALPPTGGVQIYLPLIMR